MVILLGGDGAIEERAAKRASEMTRKLRSATPATNLQQQMVDRSEEPGLSLIGRAGS